MRILVVHPGPEFSVADVCQGWTDALRKLGHQVALFNTNDLAGRLVFYCKALVDTGETDRDGYPIVKQAMPQPEAIRLAMQGLTHACYTFWPDIILFISGFFIEPGVFELLHLRGHKLVMMHTESPYQDAEQLGRAQFMDLNLLNDPTNIGVYESAAGTTLYMPHAYRPEVHYPRLGPVSPELASDLVFIGTAFQSRIDFLSRMTFHDTDFLLGGANWDEDLPRDSFLRKYLDSDAEGCVDNAQTAELYRNSRCGINFYRRESEDAHKGEGWAMGPREVEMAACGLFFLRDPRPEGDQVLPMLPTFASPEDASEQLRWWLAHDSEREELARQARAAIAGRTFDASARHMMAALEATGKPVRL